MTFVYITLPSRLFLPYISPRSPEKIAPQSLDYFSWLHLDYAYHVGSTHPKLTQTTLVVG
jgi:hypothetical protein